MANSRASRPKLMGKCLSTDIKARAADSKGSWLLAHKGGDSLTASPKEQGGRQEDARAPVCRWQSPVLTLLTSSQY